jgi:hypothetical protein
MDNFDLPLLAEFVCTANYTHTDPRPQQHEWMKKYEMKGNETLYHTDFS